MSDQESESVILVTGKLDLSKFNPEAVKSFFSRKIVHCNLRSFEHGLSSIVGELVYPLNHESGLDSIVVKVYPSILDKNKVVSDTVSNLINVKYLYEFVAFEGKLEPYPGADTVNDRIVVSICRSINTENPIKRISSTDLEYMMLTDT